MIATLTTLLLLLAPTIPGPRQVPDPTGPVVDAADVLSPATEAMVSRWLASHHHTEGHQVAVLTLPDLGGRTIEAVAVDVARAWGLGHGEADDGVLVLIAVAERQSRIEVGLGLQGVLTDLRAGAILRDVLRPSLAQDDYDTAVSRGIDAILDLLPGGEPGELGRSSGAAEDESFDELPFWGRVGLGLFLSLFLVGVSFFALALGGGGQLALFLIFGNPLAAGLGFVTGPWPYVWGGYVGLFLLLAAFLAFAPAGRAWRKRVGRGFSTGSSAGSTGAGSSSAWSTSDTGSSSSGASSYAGGGGDFDGGGASDDY